MAALLNPDGRQVVDVNGKNLKIGSLVTDDMFGECFTKGTVVLDRGEGFNVLFDWRQPKDKEGLIGQKVYMRWEKYGWQLGKITDVVTQKTPQLFKKFNFRVIWSDGGKGPVKLDAASYACGPDARFNSWVVLEEV